MNRKLANTLLILAVLSILAVSNSWSEQLAPIRVGWIGPLTGPTAKWGTYQAALLAVEEVNNSGGINGRKFELIFEDAQCNGTKAVSAFHKLADSDSVSFIIGGHCSPESLSFAPLAERKKIISIAVITSSPKLSTMGDYIFRVTPVSTRLADLLAPYAVTHFGFKKAAVIYETTDYVEPVALRFSEMFKQSGGRISAEIPFMPGETEFKSMLLKAAQSGAEALYLGTQAPDTALLLMRQFIQLNLKMKIFGNEQFAGALLSANDSDKALLEGVIFAEPECNLNQESTKKFSDLYLRRYQVQALPFSCYTGESYDATLILAAALKKCGENVECVKAELYQLKNYPGASGLISFDHNGDVDKKYQMKIVKHSKITTIE